MSEEVFKKAAQWVRDLPKEPKEGDVVLDNTQKLEFYSLFKQGTEGDVTGSQPWAVQLEARAKWDAWNGRKGMSKEEAQKVYVEKLVALGFQP